MSMPHRCRCSICGHYMDGLGFPWESPDRECQHDLEKPFSTIRDGVCFVCKKSPAQETRVGNPCICVERLALQANPDCPIHGVEATANRRVE